jgi:hypothetical protein
MRVEILKNEGWVPVGANAAAPLVRHAGSAR